MESSKAVRQRLGLTIVITVGATYVLSLLVIGLLMNLTSVTVQMAQAIRLAIAAITGFSAWHILKLEKQSKRSQHHQPNPPTETNNHHPG